jgi:hypothetical protein
VAGEWAGVFDEGIAGAAQELAIDLGGAGFVLNVGHTGFEEERAGAVAVDLGVITPRVAGPPLAGVRIVVEVVERVRRSRYGFSLNGSRWIASGVEEALDGYVRRDRVGEIPAIGERIGEVDEAGGGEARLEVDHGVAAGFIGVGPEDYGGIAGQERVDSGPLDTFGAALPGDNDVGREEFRGRDGGFLTLDDENRVGWAPCEEVEVE